MGWMDGWMDVSTHHPGETSRIPSQTLHLGPRRTQSTVGERDGMGWNEEMNGCPPLEEKQDNDVLSIEGWMD